MKHQIVYCNLSGIGSGLAESVTYWIVIKQPLHLIRVMDIDRRNNEEWKVANIDEHCPCKHTHQSRQKSRLFVSYN